MPGWPVNASCKIIVDTVIPTEATTTTLLDRFMSLFTQEEELEDNNLGLITPTEAAVLNAILESSNIYYNSSGLYPCTDFNDT
jgi:hypothetical protein